MRRNKEDALSLEVSAVVDGDVLGEVMTRDVTMEDMAWN